jgi:hypothetical protein
MLSPYGRGSLHTFLNLNRKYVIKLFMQIFWMFKCVYIFEGPLHIPKNGFHSIQITFES